jgi:osmoprotectant transport system substrate-binding protein
VQKGRITRVIAALVLWCALLGACTEDPRSASGSDDGGNAIIVGSFDFPESRLLGEIYSQALERAGLSVERRLDFGPREITFPALEQGMLDMMIEYSGTGLEFTSLGRVSPTSNSESTYMRYSKLLSARGLVALEPARAQTRNTFVTTFPVAVHEKLTKISDLHDVASRFLLGGPPECPDRAFCMQGLRSVYKLRFDDFLSLDAAGPLTVSALRSGQIDVALLFSTSPAIDRFGFVQLRDDKHLQPAENVTPVIDSATLARMPRIRSTVNRVTRHLTTGVLRDLNGALELNGSNLEQVATGWLESLPELR